MIYSPGSVYWWVLCHGLALVSKKNDICDPFWSQQEYLHLLLLVTISKSTLDTSKIDNNDLTLWVYYCIEKCHMWGEWRHLHVGLKCIQWHSLFSYLNMCFDENSFLISTKSWFWTNDRYLTCGWHANIQIKHNHSYTRWHICYSVLILCM